MLPAVLLTLLLQASFRSPSCVAGEGWEFVVRGHDVNNSPRWYEEADAPPLAPRVAIRAARSLLERMSCRHADQWELAAVALRPLAGERDVWIYVITFVEPFALPKEGFGSTLRRLVEVPVLLDGTALSPAVGAWPPKR